MSHIEQRVRDVRRKYRTVWDKDLPPATDADIESANDWARSHYGESLPTELIGFWRLADGCGGNTAHLYGPDEAVRTTELYIEDYPQYFLVGDHGDHAMFALRFPSLTWVSLEQGDFDAGPRKTRTSFAEVADHVIDVIEKREVETW